MDVDFKELTEEVLSKLEELKAEVEKASSETHGYKAAAKRARKVARKLKNELFPAWIKASPK